MPAVAVLALADPTALSRVLVNLVGNAIKFTERGAVVLRVRAGNATDARVWVDVADTGRGVAPEFLPRLFAPFRQESSGHGRSHEGSGLGLAITKRLAEAMGGGVEVRTRTGQGSVFSVWLPAATPAAAGDGAAGGAPALAVAEGVLEA
jgi:signal transduction histidine kinase